MSRATEGPSEGSQPHESRAGPLQVLDLADLEVDLATSTPLRK